MLSTKYIFWVSFALILFTYSVAEAKAPLQGVGVNTSKLWLQYAEAREAGAEPVLADFSHAGYHRREEVIPTVDWKVFDVTDFGAKPDDGKSDKEALRRTIAAAEENGSGIVYFPKGRFLVNEKNDDWNEPIFVRTSRIVFRGSGSGEGGTELYMDSHMNPVFPSKLWTCPYLLQIKGEGVVKKASSVSADARRETFWVEVENASLFLPGEWVVLSLLDNSPETVAEAVAPYTPEPGWTALINKGLKIDEIHQVAEIVGRRLRFEEPIHSNVKEAQGWSVKGYRPLEEIGVEHIAFRGNWQEAFVHHKSAIHDGGWSMLSLSKCVNSWIRDCRFTDWNRPVSVGGSAGVTVQDLLLDGTKGHSAVGVHDATHVLVQRVNDVSGHHHASGISRSSAGNVFLRCDYRSDTCFESHASQPRWTLFDNISGGWMYGRWGGAAHNQPNHLHGLIFWNYENTGAGEPGAFHFMRPDSEYGRIIMPYVIGFHGNPQEWVEDEIETLESNGAPVYPQSLYESQLEARRASGF